MENQNDPTPVSNPSVSAKPVSLGYTNWRGEFTERSITPIRVHFGATDWHPEPQWLLEAFDHDRGANRDFALKDFGDPVNTPSANVMGIEDLIDAALFRIGPYLNGTYSDATRRSIVRTTVEEIVTALSATTTEGK